jgi:GDP-L-fucose synthase
MVGSALVRRLRSENLAEILTTNRADVNLVDQDAVTRWMQENKPDTVIVAAAKVGGIHANDTYPAQFLYENLLIASNIIHASHLTDVAKLLFLGSSCIYPKMAPQPIMEDALLTGPLEPTNEWYAIAKIAGIKLCQAYRRQYGKDFISAMPTNLYGPGDNYHPENSHVIPALIRKAHTAKITDAPSMVMWGTGTVKREFLHADDCADALVHILKNYSGEEHVNVGFGSDVTIEQVTRLVMEVVGYSGGLTSDLSKPDGTPRKLMSSSKLHAMGWRPQFSLEDGIKDAYSWYLKYEAKIPD